MIDEQVLIGWAVLAVWIGVAIMLYRRRRWPPLYDAGHKLIEAVFWPVVFPIGFAMAAIYAVAILCWRGVTFVISARAKRPPH